MTVKKGTQSNQSFAYQRREREGLIVTGATGDLGVAIVQRLISQRLDWLTTNTIAPRGERKKKETHYGSAP
jgi:NAD(P)-dependent dehydrogenase (short-subunit alcohol dehydrogenase family)